MLILRFALIAGLLVGGAGLMWKIAPTKSKLLVLRDEPHFPVVSGFNLNQAVIPINKAVTATTMNGDFGPIVSHM